MWQKKNRWVIMALAAVLVLLAALAFWPERERELPPRPTPTAEASPTYAAEVSPAQTEEPAAQTPSALPNPVETPSATPPSPTPTAESKASPVPTAVESTASSESYAEDLTCTLSISCAVLLDHLDELPDGERELVPDDGWLFPAAELPFSQEESVFDVLLRTCREENIHLDFSSTLFFPSAYVKGIGNLYEFDCGPMSGWTYTVNGQKPNVGCSSYFIEPGDVIAWQYTLSADGF